MQPTSASPVRFSGFYEVKLPKRSFDALDIPTGCHVASSFPGSVYTHVYVPKWHEDQFEKSLNAAKRQMPDSGASKSVRWDKWEERDIVGLSSEISHNRLKRILDLWAQERHVFWNPASTVSQAPLKVGKPSLWSLRWLTTRLA